MSSVNDVPLSVAAVRSGQDPFASPSANPAFTSSNSQYRVGGGDRSLTWSPGDGSVQYSDKGLPLPGQGQGAVVQPFLETSAALAAKSGGGKTEFTVSGSLRTGVSVDTARVDAELSAGERVRYRVILPGENRDFADAASINPLNPTTLPVGATAILDQQAFEKTDLAVNFRRIAMQTQVTDAEGVSYAVSRLDNENVRVTMGPTKVIEAMNTVGFQTPMLTVWAGRQDSLAHSSLSAATFDLSEQQAQTAYQQFVGTGQVDHQVAGVSDVAKLQQLAYNSQTRAGVDTPVGGIDLAGVAADASRTQVIYPDGSFTSTNRLSYSGQVPLTITRAFDQDGNEVEGTRRFQFDVDTRGEHGRATTQLLNAALTGDWKADGPHKPGSVVSLSFDEDQMRTMLQNAYTSRSGVNRDFGFTHLLPVSRGETSKDVYDFAINLSKNVGQTPYKFSENLLNMSREAQPPHNLRPVVGESKPMALGEALQDRRVRAESDENPGREQGRAREGADAPSNGQRADVGSVRDRFDTLHAAVQSGDAQRIGDTLAGLAGQSTLGAVAAAAVDAREQQAQQARAEQDRQQQQAAEQRRGPAMTL